MALERHAAYWTFDNKAYAEHGERLYYFAPLHAALPPYRKQIHVTAIIDVADDGTLAGVELVMGDLPLPPVNR